MKISMIVAMADNGVIGRDKKLPWYLPGDLRWFKEDTLGKPIIMGRKTFDSIGKPLPGRTNIVSSGNADLALPEGVRLVAPLDEALAIAEGQCLIDGVDEAMVVGGQQIYSLCMPKADNVYLTRVHSEVEGDAGFKGLCEKECQIIRKETHQAVDPNPYDYSFCVYARK